MGEIAFEGWCCDEMAKDGWANRKMQYVGRKGCPDRFFFRAGEIRIVEFKRPLGTPDAVQVREHRRLRKLGIKIWVVSNRIEFEEMRRA